MAPFRCTVLLALIATAPAAAQPNASLPLSEDFVIPVHRPESGTDSLTAESLGIWAGGTTYKCRLDGGFVFFPVLGPSYAHNLTFGWTTESIAFGDAQSLANGRASEHGIGTQRYEYRWPSGTVEAYDIDASGVEQTFRIPNPPRVAGDLVVTGRVHGELTAPDCEAEHRALWFYGPRGRALVEYGTATAIDANGNAMPMTTSFDGERVRLRLDAASVANATFPLLVDPTIVATDPIRSVGMTAIGSMQGGTRPLMIVHTRINSSTDHDVIARNANNEFQLQQLSWVDIGTYDSRRVAVGAVPNRGRFVIACERRHGPSTDLVLRGQRASSFGPGSGGTAVITAATAEHYRNPALGGQQPGLFGGNDAVVTFNHVTTNHAIAARMFDPEFGTITTLPNLAVVQVETRPAINPMALDEWVVCWDEQVGQTRRVLAKKITSQGLVGIQSETLYSGTSEIPVDVKVAGGDGYYFATWESTPIGLGAHRIRGRRFDWPENQAFSSGDFRSIDLGATSGYTNEGLDFDRFSDSHWVSTFTRNDALVRSAYAVRVGANGGVIEAIQPHGSTAHRPFNTSVVFDHSGSENERFQVLYATDDSAFTLYGHEFGYDPVVFDHVPYGASCQLVQDEYADPAKAGSRQFSVSLVQPTNAIAALAIGTQSTKLPLDVVGMTGCSLLIDPLTIVASTPSPSGINTVTMRLSDVPPVFLGTFHTQWLYVAPGANPLGVVTNRGVQHEAR